MASSRDREAWSQIFKLYKGFPYLWDKNNINFGNRSMMTDGYKILTRVYRERLDKQASVGALRMKMKNLRTTYYRELRKIKLAKQKGDKYTPSLWYFEHLNFLGNPKSVECMTGTSDTHKTEDLTQAHNSSQMEDCTHDDLTLDNSDIEVDFGPSTSQTIIKNRTEPAVKTNHLERQERIEENPKRKTLKDEHWEIIGKSIGFQLQELNSTQFTIVSKLISDAIYFGRLNKLSENSHIELGQTSHADFQPESPQYSTFASDRHFSSGFQSVNVSTNQRQTSTLKHEEDTSEDE